jgi:diacylglycerol kinase family enzyme
LRQSSAAIPALLNPESGSAARARAALNADGRFRVHELKPAQVADAVRAAASRGTPRLVVSGGDGTLSAALGAAAGTALEIAVFPGGTLNHFARDAGIPIDDPAAALDVAANGTPRPVDLGYVNGHAILNTSSVGIYTEFVRRREHLEHWLNYRLASVAAAAGVWRDRRVVDVDLDTAGGTRGRFRTPLLFVGIHERILGPAGLGMRRPGGARALHILLVKAPAPLRIRRLAFQPPARGIQGLVPEKAIETYLTSKATVEMAEEPGTIAIDGELRATTSPLRYEFVPAAVKVVHR